MANSIIPTLASLALQYGTINKQQYHSLTALHALKANNGNPMVYGQLLLSQKLATRYQIGLLTLIQEYHIIKKRGEEFGRIAIEKGFATQIDVQRAVEFQKNEFKRARIRKLIGDILVESRVITIKQKNSILKEQLLLEQEANDIFLPDSGDTLAAGTPIKKSLAPLSADDSDLSEYEKKFLQIKLLDREFAARVTEKGLASERQVMIAQRVQEEAFEKKDTLKVLGDIMVFMSFITEQQKNIIIEEQARSQAASDPDEKDASIEVIISPDKMVARFKIDKKSLAETSVAQLKTVLKSHGISNGIYPDALLQGQLNLGKLEFPAARSDALSEQMKENGLVFYLETRLTEQGEKRKGDLLAEKSPQKIRIKKDVLGNGVRQDGGKDISTCCGSGTRPSQDGSGVVAVKTGVPSVSIEGKLFVHPIIHVLEDADLRYGPLEAYANLSISGVLTGAYPITAGSITAREIRGARIESIGDIRVDVGITDTIIRSQGDIHARYLHNCQIETFGNVYIKNEIFDSKITISGKLDSPGCRIISSSIFAKKGVTLAGVGSEKTQPCTILAGGEHHVLQLGTSIYQEIARVSKKRETLIEKKEAQEHRSQKAFQKMVELKIFHDRSKRKKQVLAKEFKTNSDHLTKEKLQNITRLISNFEARMEKSIASLKGINKKKQVHDQNKIKLENKINLLTPRVNAEIMALEEIMFLFFEWSRYQENISRIEILGKAFPGTVFSGIYSSTKIESSMEKFSIFEIEDSGNHKLEVLTQ